MTETTSLETISPESTTDIDIESSQVHLFNMAKGRRPSKSATSETSHGDYNTLAGESDTDETDPLLSLRSKQAEERSCRDIFKSGERSTEVNLMEPTRQRGDICVALFGRMCDVRLRE